MSNLARQELYFGKFYSLDEILASIEAVANPTIAHRISCPVNAMFVLYFIHQQRESRRLALQT
jgi:hypothetical protein